MTKVRTCIVTGATGQDGSYLCERLLGEGEHVIAFVRPGDEAPLDPRITQVSVDLADARSAAAAIRAHCADEIYLLGGISSVAYSFAEPVRTGEVTGLSALAMIEAAVELTSNGASPRVVHAASSEIFGVPASAPQNESTPIAPTSPYGVAKAMGHLSVGAARARGVHASSLVLYNHESPRRPPSFVTRKITSTVAAISLGQAEELVLGNMEARRDWGWAPDFVDAMVRAARASEPDDYVVATGQAHSVADFVAAACARVGITDWESIVRVDPAFFRPVDATTLVGDSSKARTALGWQPTKDFVEIVHAMVDEDLAVLSGAHAP